MAFSGQIPCLFKVVHKKCVGYFLGRCKISTQRIKYNEKRVSFYIYRNATSEVCTCHKHTKIYMISV